MLFVNIFKLICLDKPSNIGTEIISQIALMCRSITWNDTGREKLHSVQQSASGQPIGRICIHLRHKFNKFKQPSDQSTSRPLFGKLNIREIYAPELLLLLSPHVPSSAGPAYVQLLSPCTSALIIR